MKTPKKRRFIPPNRIHPKGFRFQLPNMDEDGCIDITSDNETGKCPQMEFNCKQLKMHFNPNIILYLPHTSA